MPDNDFWIGQEQIPVDLSLLLTYSNLRGSDGEPCAASHRYADCQA